MAENYTLILQECPEECREHVAQFLGKAFGLKDKTSADIAGSAPIALLTDLTGDEAATMNLVLTSIQLQGVVIKFTNKTTDELPKIDWPKRPLIFKREIAEFVADMAMPVACPDCGKTNPLQRLLNVRLGLISRSGATSAHYRPQDIPEVAAATAGAKPAGTPGPKTGAGTGKVQEFKGSQLPEITPFFNAALPSAPAPAAQPGTDRSNRPASDNDAAARLNELFPDDESSGFIPNSNDITNILNRLLPDEDPNAHPAKTGTGRIAASAAGSGFSVFLAKIGDEARRAKAVPLLAELAKITPAEADVLSKKVIIPVLKSVTKAAAEDAKQRFAKIGILARIKGAETLAG